MTAANGWGRDVFALALAIQMLLWGAAQPFAGALADRFGAVWVLMGGALLYAAGIVWMAYATTPLEFYLSGGRADRFRPRRLLVHAGDRRVRQAAACRNGAPSRSAQAPRPDRSGSSCSRRWRSR